MSTNILAELLKFDKGKPFYDSKEAFEQLIATMSQVASLAPLIFSGSVPSQAFTKVSMYNIDIATSDTIEVSCSKNLFNKIFQEGDTEPVPDKMNILKSQIGSYYKATEEWNKSIALLVGMTHFSNSKNMIQELMTNNSYRLAKMYSNPRAMFLVIEGKLSLGGGSTGDTKSRNLQFARFVREVCLIIQGDSESITDYIIRMEKAIYKIKSIEIDITGSFAQRTLRNLLLTGANKHVRDDIRMAVKDSQIENLLTFQGAKDLLVQWTDDNDNIDTSFADNAGSKRVAAINLTDHRSSQKLGLYDGAKSGRTSNRPMKGSQCFLCGITDDHWPDHCSLTSIEWDDAARTRFTEYRNHVFKKNKDSKSNKQKKINKAAADGKKTSASADTESDQE